MKFFRFNQTRIDFAGIGLLGCVTNHGFLDNVTFRRMRKSLLETFSRISVLDLHGNARKKEKAPDGSKDQNVFDIQQGVAISIGVNHPAVPKQIQHAELYGLRQSKGIELDKPANPAHSKPSAKKPFHLFIPQNEPLAAEYEKGWKIDEIMPVNTVGIDTGRDFLAIHKSKEKLWQVIQDFANLPENELRLKYQIKADTRGGWNLKDAQNDVIESGPSQSKIARILYRPFDVRLIYYTAKSSGFLMRPRHSVMRHMIGVWNLGLIANRTQLTRTHSVWNKVFVADGVIDTHITGEKGYLFPLWLYSGEGEMMGERRRANFSPRFLKALANALDLPPSEEAR